MPRLQKDGTHQRLARRTADTVALDVVVAAARCLMTAIRSFSLAGPRERPVLEPRANKTEDACP